MRNTYSLYEAKAKLSELVRKVREGRSVTITVHGEPVAEMRPVRAEGKTLDAHFDALVARGVVIPATAPPTQIRPVARRRGALQRFLRDRD